MMKILGYTFFILLWGLVPVKESSAGSLIVMASGFNSCKTFTKKSYKENYNDGSDQRAYYKYGATPYMADMHKTFLEVQERSGARESSPYIASCFTGLFGDEHLYYITSFDPLRPKKISIDNYYRLILNFYRGFKDSLQIDNVEFIGHSHGGWLAMNSVLLLSNYLPINNLYTVDPISKDSCSKKILLKEGLDKIKLLTSWPFKFFKKIYRCAFDAKNHLNINLKTAAKFCKNKFVENNEPINIKQYLTEVFSDPNDQCLKHPDDFDKDRIRNGVLFWKNYYQSSTLFLHSSKIDEADANEKVSNKHTEIDNHQRIWEEFFGFGF